MKNSRINFKIPERLNSSPKTPRKKEGFIEMLKKFLRKELNAKALKIQIENLFKT
jgi:hypothetical protein